MFEVSSSDTLGAVRALSGSRPGSVADRGTDYPPRGSWLFPPIPATIRRCLYMHNIRKNNVLLIKGGLML